MIAVSKGTRPEHVEESDTRRGSSLTDDNQLLAYGPKRHRAYTVTGDMLMNNLALVARSAALASPR